MAALAVTVRKVGQAAYLRTMYWVVRPTLGAIPRRWYGNDAGWLNNWKTNREFGRLRAGVQIPVGMEEEPRRAQLRSEGFCRVYPAWDPRRGRNGEPHITPAWERGLLETIRTNAARLLDDPRESVPLAVGGYSVGLPRPIKQIPDIAHLVTDEIADLVAAYYGTQCNVARVSLWRNKHVPAYDGRREFYSDFWHCDEYLTWRLKLFVNLTDVTRETGALRVHSLSTTRRLMREGYLTRYWIVGRARELINDPSRIVYNEGPVGSGILCNTQLCLHAASVPREGTYRDIIEISFEPSRLPLSKHWADQLAA